MSASESFQLAHISHIFKMEEDEDSKEDTKRKSRNLSEKRRRDQFNALVNELNSMVATTTRKMDKSTVLKSTISFLKVHNEISIQTRMHEIKENWKPSFLTNEEFTHLFLEALDGFIMVVSSSGRIFYTSESITSLLGYLPSEILNTSLYDMAFDDERPKLYNMLQNNCNGVPPDVSINQGAQLTFSCYIKRGCFDFREKPLFELVQFIGYFKTNVDTHAIEISPGNRFNLSVTQNDTRLLFICTGRLTTPQVIRDMSIINPSKNEFISRHSLEWKFLFLDHRAPPIIGYLPFEVLGTSGYDYYHFDDLDKVVACHEALLQTGEGTSCYYRFLTKGQQWIWLQTRFFITYHQWNSKPEFVVCTHRVVSYIDVMKSLQRESMAINKVCLSTVSRHDQKPQLQFNNQLKINPVLNSSWPKIYSKAPRFSSTPEPYGRYSSTIHSSGAGSDTGSMSTESMVSMQSFNTHHSNQGHDRGTRRFQFKRTRSQHSDKSSSTYMSCALTPRGSHQAELLHSPLTPRGSHQAELLHSPLTPRGSHQAELLHSPLTPRGSHQAELLHSPLHSQQTSVIVQRPLHSTPILPQYVESSQYLAVQPVQPVIGFQQIQTLPPSPEVGMLVTPVQAHVQDQLQKKHEELQQMIIRQQKELRRVSEQLVMAKYGLLPPIINVSLPYSIEGASSDATDIFSAGIMPAGPQHSIMDQSMQQIVDTNEYIPMQMSQQQAQLLFSSSTQNQITDGKYQLL